MKRRLKSLSKICLMFMVFVFSVFVFSACSDIFNADGLVPEIFIKTDASLEYKKNEEIYKLELLPNESYEIVADLGIYDEEEFFIEYVLESEDGLLSLDGNKIISPQEFTEETVERVLVRLRKQNEEKIYRVETIEVSILFEKSE